MFTPDMLSAPPESMSLSKVLVGIPERKVPYCPVPMTSTTDHPIYLDRRKVIGHWETTITVYSAGFQPKDNEQKETLHKTQTEGTIVERPKVWDPAVDLSHLAETQWDAGMAI